MSCIDVPNTPLTQNQQQALIIRGAHPATIESSRLTTIPPIGNCPEPPKFEPLAVLIDPSPSSGSIPLSVSFKSSVSGGIAPFVYAWDFGDATESSEVNPVHLYSTAGVFQATLKVTDTRGDTAQASAEITAIPTIGLLVSASALDVGSVAAPAFSVNAGQIILVMATSRGGGANADVSNVTDSDNNVYSLVHQDDVAITSANDFLALFKAVAAHTVGSLTVTAFFGSPTEATIMVMSVNNGGSTLNWANAGTQSPGSSTSVSIQPTTLIGAPSMAVLLVGNPATITSPGWIVQQSANFTTGFYIPKYNGNAASATFLADPNWLLVASIN